MTDFSYLAPKLCPVAGCLTPIEPRFCMCAPHWHRLPKDLQAKIHSAARRKAWSEYRLVRQQACQHFHP